MINICAIQGRLTREVALAYTPSGTPVVKNAIAWNKKIKDNERHHFLNITIWGKSAEYFSKWAKKGQRITLTGELEYSFWEKKDGTKGSDVSLNVTGFQLEHDRPKEQIEKEFEDTQILSNPEYSSDDIPF